MNALEIRYLSSCLLCADAPCTKACDKLNKPDKTIRSLRFNNYLGAISHINDSCINCDAKCEKSCVLSNSVKIKDIMLGCLKQKEKFKKEIKKADISTDFCGIKIENPFLLSSSVVASSYEMVSRAFDAGWAGAAFKTISLIDIHEASPRFSALKNLDGSFLAFKNIEQLSDHSVIENVEIFKKLKQNYPNKFLLVSIMGRNDEEWAYLAKVSEEAGADALELNFSCPNMTEEHSGSDIGQVPELVKRYTKIVKDAVKIPVVAKLTPNVLSVVPAALAAKEGNADGVALINTIKSITELNTVKNMYLGKNARENFSVGGLSGSAVKPIALRFISEISANKDLKDLYISGMGGIYNFEDALMFLALGASSVQITTAVMEYGYRIIDDLKEGLELFLGTFGAKSIKELKGFNIENLKDVTERKRDIAILPKFIRSNCVGCGRCYISCMDGGHQAISFKDRKPILNPNNCVGCHLCILVCPNEAITPSDVILDKSKK